MTTSRIWICIAAITLAAAVGTGHRVETVVKPLPVGVPFR